MQRKKMDSRIQLSDSQSVIPVFMGKDKNVSFILDTSENMAAFLGAVKNLVIQTLLTKASLRNSMFNIVTYSYKISSLSDHMIPCAPDTVYEALGWIHTLRTSPGSDLLTALTTAFSDPACQSVHLVTTSLPDSPEKCLNTLSAFTFRPVNTFYISESQTVENDSLDFLKCFTSATRGRCYKLSLNSDSTAGQVTLLHLAERPMQDLPCCQMSCYQPMLAACLSPYWCSCRNPFSVRSCISSRMTRGSEFLPGCRVLARREIDGFYFLGTIAQQLQDRAGLFMVMFDEPVPKDNAATGSPQLTCKPDMVNLAQAHGHSLVPGDTVLAPWEPLVNRFGPGRIVSVVDPMKSVEGDRLVILFWNGFKMRVPKNLAVWIPASKHEQIIRELQSHLCRSGCQSHCDYLKWSPACCVSHCPFPTSSMCHCSIKSGPLLNTPLLMDDQWKDAVNTDHLKDTDLTKSALALSSSSDLSEDEEEDASKKINCTGLELVSRSVNTEISCLRKPLSGSHGRPAWKYWKRGLLEPHHKQPGKDTKQPHVRESWTGLKNDSLYFSSNSTSANHSSLFETVPNSVRRSVIVKDVLGWTGPRLSSKELKTSEQTFSHTNI